MSKFKKSYNSLSDLANIPVFSEKESTSKLGFNHVQTLNVFRALNYSLGQAVCDLIDNSVDAEGSKNIRVNYELNDFGVYLCIIDDGKGLDEITIDKDMQIGVTNKARNKDSLGKFGVGMKLSSLSIADTVTMISKQVKLNPVHRTLSWKYIKKHNKLELLKNFNKDLIGSLDADYIINTEFSDNSKHGTILLLTDFRKTYNNKIANDRQLHTKECNYLKSFIARTYHIMLENGDISIEFNGEELEPLNPFYKDTENKNNPRNGYQVETKFITYKGQPIHVDFMLIPRTDQIKSHPDYDRLKDINNYDKNSQSAVYVYRNNRLISFDGWRLATQWAFHPSHNCARIAIYLDSKLDDSLGLDPTKTSYDFPSDLIENIKFETEVKKEIWGFQKKPKATYGESAVDKHKKPKNVKPPKPIIPQPPKPIIPQPPKPIIPQPPKPIIPQPPKPITNHISNEQLQLDFKVCTSHQPTNSELIWVDGEEVVINKAHANYDDFLQEVKKIIDGKA
jgi:anti-sigma regulatory factor (Ser/Thr protein kinase)